jgi:tungstate transport system substrate-binding protein
MAKAGKADVILTNSPEAERRLITDGFAVARLPVLRNDYVIVGPANDPAGVKAASSTAQALNAIAAQGAPFVSRGDGSAANIREIELWRAANLNPIRVRGYRRMLMLMPTALKFASQSQAYTLCDRATFLSMRQSLKLEVLHQGDESLQAIYRVITLNPKKNAALANGAGERFARWLVSAEAQKLIAAYGKDKYGTQLFIAYAGGRARR